MSSGFNLRDHPSRILRRNCNLETRNPVDIQQLYNSTWKWSFKYKFREKRAQRMSINIALIWLQSSSQTRGEKRKLHANHSLLTKWIVSVKTQKPAPATSVFIRDVLEEHALRRKSRSYRQQFQPLETISRWRTLKQPSTDASVRGGTRNFKVGTNQLEVLEQESTKCEAHQSHVYTTKSCTNCPYRRCFIL
jgi:hypothetical protein